MRCREAGFTLVEMLIVMVIFGILVVLIVLSYGGQLQKTRLQNAVSTFSTDLEKARSAAWKSGKSVTVSVLANKSGYIYTVNDLTPSIQTIPLQDGVTFQNTGTVTYSPPFADVDASSNNFTLVSPNSNLTDSVRVIGVTGKVIR